MNRVKRTRKKANPLIRVVVVAAVVFAFVKMVQLQVQINEKQEQLDGLQQEIAAAQIQNEDLVAKSENPDTPEGQKQHLRDNGYVEYDDQVYVIVGDE